MWPGEEALAAARGCRYFVTDPRARLLAQSAYRQRRLDEALGYWWELYSLIEEPADRRDVLDWIDRCHWELEHPKA